MTAAAFRQAAKNKDSNRSLSRVFASAPTDRKLPLISRFLLKTGLQDKAFLSAFYVALPNALITLCVRLLASEGLLPWIKADAEDDRLITVQTAVWTSTVAGLSFLVVLRASQAYTRFWQAITSVHLLQIEWLDACGSLFAFCATSSAPRSDVQNFKHLIVRLFSMYHAAALLRLVEPGIDDDAIAGITVLDPGSLDPSTTKAFSESAHRLELVGQWIQVSIMHGIQDKVVTAPPPIVSRCFQEIANGNVKFQDALKVKSIPFPQAYQLVCDLLLLMHYIATPFLTSLWVNSPALSAMLAFFAVFAFWSLIFVARSIENPFCTQHFIRDAVFMQDDLNARLLTLILPIAAEKPNMPTIPEAQVEAHMIQEVTLDTFWANELQQENRNASHLVNLVTEASRVNFGSTSMPMQAFMNTSDRSETRMSSRQRPRPSEFDINFGSASIDSSQRAQSEASSDAPEVEDEGHARAPHDTPMVFDAPMTAAIQSSVANSTGKVTVSKWRSDCQQSQLSLQRSRHSECAGNERKARAIAEHSL